MLCRWVRFDERHRGKLKEALLRKRGDDEAAAAEERVFPRHVGVGKRRAVRRPDFPTVNVVVRSSTTFQDLRILSLRAALPLGRRRRSFTVP